MKENDKKPKFSVGAIVCTVFTVIIGVFAAILIISLITAKVKKRPASFFGVSFSIVQTPSMEPEISVGDLILFKKCSYGDIAVEDDIVFVADENFSPQVRGSTVVHRVEEVKESGIVTKGINNPGRDGGLREEPEIYGKCIGHSTFWGKVFKFFTKFGIPLLIICVALPFIIFQIIKIIRLAKEKDGDSTPKQTGGNDKPSE